MHAEIPPPERILTIGCGYRASKVLLSAIELDIFTVLSDRPLDTAALARRIGIQDRGARNFFDALVALGLLARDADGRYAPTPETGCYLDRQKPTYIGSMFEQYNASEYGLWGSLTQALRTGSPQTGIAAAQHFASLYADPERFRRFVKSMTGGTLLTARAIAAQFPWRHYRTVIDIGTAEGCLPVEVALAHPHISGGGFDLPELRAMFEANVRERRLTGRMQFHPGDFFTMPLPSAEVIVLGRILHNWNLDIKRMLLAKAHNALPTGGVLIVHETLIPEDRRSGTPGLLASLNMLLWTAGGYDFTGSECARWMKEAGFGDIRVEPLSSEQSMVIGRK
ncbi:MAG TPA: methyltransferase [Micropepsaceae bacterium]|nr:methyltransferase [Micropepsaceae bacterium]